MRKWEIDRRACLRGAGVSIGLPVLEAMLPGMERARAAGAAAPKRSVCFVFMLGIPDTTYLTTGYGHGTTPNPGPGSFWPRTEGPDFEITPILKPMEQAGLKGDFSVIRNLHNAIGEMESLAPMFGGVAPGGHGTAGVTILTGAEPGGFPDPKVLEGATKCGPSVDQVAAAHFRREDPSLLSLYLGNPVHPDANGMMMCWKNATTRAPYTDQPSKAFKAIFGDGTVDAKTTDKRRVYRQSVLHQASAAARRLKQRLGQADQQHLDKYLESINDLEKRITAPANLSQCATPGTPPKDTDLTDNRQPCSDPDSCYAEQAHRFQIDVPTHFQAMSEIIVHGFQCDRVRSVVVHIMTGALRFSWLGPPYDQYADYHGDISHGASEKIEEPNRAKTYIAGSASMVAQFAYLMKRLKETPENDGSGMLLDHTAMVCTSELSHGSGHNFRHLPVIVGGGAGGLVPRGQGRYIVPQRGGELPIANLYVTMLNALGVKDDAGRDIASFGNSTGALSLS